MLDRLFTEENKSFARLLISLALPIMLQNLINSGLNMLDVFMIGQLGTLEITAVGLANKVFFLFTLIGFGVNSGAAIYLAQYWGRGDVDSIHKTMGIGFAFNLAASIVFCLGALCFPSQILYIFSKDPAVIALGVKYLHIVGPSYLFCAISNTLSYSCRSVGHPALPMFIALFSLCCNGVLNAVFIFGLLGCPAMGVEGAALGTLISRALELIVTVTAIKKKHWPIDAPIKKYLSFTHSDVKSFLHTAGFVILNETFWSLGVSLCNSGYRFAGTDAQAAVEIAANVKDLFMVVSYGIGAAAAVIIGHRLGCGQKDEAVHYAKKLKKVTLCFGVLISILIVITIPYIVRLFNVSDQVRLWARYITYGLAAVFPLRCLGHLNIVGILRSGGDTRVCMLIDIFGVWCIGLPLSFLGTLVFHLPIYWVTFLVFQEETIKSFISEHRVRQKKWLQDIRL